MSASAVPSTSTCPLAALRQSVWKATRLPLARSTVRRASRLSPTWQRSKQGEPGEVSGRAGQGGQGEVSARQGRVSRAGWAGQSNSQARGGRAGQASEGYGPCMRMR